MRTTTKVLTPFTNVLNCNYPQGLAVQGIPAVCAEYKYRDFGELNLAGAMLEHSNFSGATVNGSNFAGAHMPSAYLSGTHARNANFTGTYLAGADLSHGVFVGANFKNANLSNTTLKYTNFNNANLEGAAMGGLDLRRTILTGANLTGAWLHSCIGNGGTVHSINLEGSSVVFTKTTVYISIMCGGGDLLNSGAYPIKQFLSITPAQIALLGERLLPAFWLKWGTVITTIINNSKVI